MQTVFPTRTKNSMSISETVSLPGFSITTVFVTSPNHNMHFSGFSLFPYGRGTSALSQGLQVRVEGSPEEDGWAAEDLLIPSLDIQPKVKGLSPQDCPS